MKFFKSFIKKHKKLLLSILTEIIFEFSLVIIALFLLISMTDNIGIVNFLIGGFFIFSLVLLLFGINDFINNKIEKM